MLGTIDYVAPEQVKGGPVDGRADQYSLGCVLFECVTGTVPFRRDSELAVLWAHVHDPPPPVREYRPDLPAALDEVIDRALAKDPGDRHRSCAALVAALQPALAGTTPYGPRRRLGRPTRRHPRQRRRPRLPVLAAAVGVLVAVVLAAAVLAARDNPAPPRSAASAAPEAANQAVRVDSASYQTTAVPVALAASVDAVWMVGRTRSGGLLARIDALTNQVDPTVRLPYAPTGLAITRDGRTAWVAAPADQAIHRVDTRTGSVAERVQLPLAPDQVAFGADAVWVTSSEGDAVMRVDVGGQKVQAIPVGNGPTGIAFGADRVWVANRQDGTVSRIDPETNEVGTLHLGFRPTAVAVDQGAVWVALAP